MKKAIGFISLVVVVLALAAGIVGAQDNSGGNRPGGRGGNNRPFGPGNGLLAEASDIVQDQTGLTAQEIRQQLADGKTLEQVITDNGGDVEVVVTGIVTAATDRINQAVKDGKMTQDAADKMLANLEENVRSALTTGMPMGGMGGNGRPDGGLARPVIQLSEILLEKAGLDAQQVREALRNGQSVAYLITAAGGDVAGVIDATVKEATDRINGAVAAGNMEQARADELLNNLESTVTLLVNGDGSNMNNNMRRPVRQLVNAVAEATGLTAQDVVQQVRDGATLSSILTGKNVNVDTFIDEQLAPVKERLDAAVKNGTMSQAVADARLNLRRVELTDALNRTLPAQTDEATPEATADASA